jgi:hypothetical protein
LYGFPSVRLSNEDHSCFPCFPERHIDTVYTPDGQHVGGVPAGDPDDVLRQEVAPDILFRTVEECQVGALAALRGESAVEIEQRLTRVAGRRWNECNLGSGLSDQLQEILDDRMGRAGGWPEPAEGNDLSLCHEGFLCGVGVSRLRVAPAPRLAEQEIALVQVTMDQPELSGSSLNAFRVAKILGIAAATTLPASVV